MMPDLLLLQGVAIACSAPTLVLDKLSKESAIQGYKSLHIWGGFWSEESGQRNLVKVEQHIYQWRQSGQDCLTFKQQVDVQFPKRHPVTEMTSNLKVLSVAGRVYSQQSSLANCFKDL
ncbi:uncharacterized protein [Watersipora subatra]|uniref:uncharacterized protein n=1 Tax=Watersipora subatra TaxID=2589382 RepID=UPI00355BA598